MPKENDGHISGMPLSGAYRALEINSFVLDYKQIYLREVLNIEEPPCDLFILREGLPYRLHEKNLALNNQTVRDWVEAGITKIFVKTIDHKILISKQNENLRSNTRSLSIGDPFEKSRRQTSLLASHLKFFYEDTTNDELLNLLYQSVRSYAHFLMDHMKIHHMTYTDFSRQKHHYIHSQPVLSSLFLIGVLKQARIFNDKDIENFFVTSFFKDVGMSCIPFEKYAQKELNLNDKKLLVNHAQNSASILLNRIPISTNCFKIIENHHIFSTLTRELEHFTPESSQQLIMGIETVLISITDIIAAMISERPYRPATSLFQSLDLIRELISNQHPQEFKLLISYFKNYFSKNKAN
ncbi:MAG: hypothetical protein HYV97_06895 [Bdellovibrio sp.]|nr:hypothetical protein [Bdellovibrio sp.]